MTRKRQKILLEPGAWEGSCGTQKQQRTGQAPRGFTDAVRQKMLLEQGAWEGSCGTSIGEQMDEDTGNHNLWYRDGT